MLKRVSITWDAQRGYHVALPTYFMIAGTWLPLQPGLLHSDGAFPNAEPADVLALNPTVIVSLPEDECIDDARQIDKLAIAQKYAGHPLYDSADYVPPTLRDFHPIELDPPKDATVFERIAKAMGFNRA